ncbi:MAG TPA: DUF6782 family putative metallopeptidase [Pyrinomonadaceae bacterium]|jgi:hypothetical protein|nr:DUF6782 family putative metallopeptidase [Pyrinomonadaceae bacterium]
MSKKFKLPSGGLLVSVIMTLAALLAGGAARGGAARQAGAGAAVNAKSAAVVAATAEVLRETSEVRKLPILRSVRSGAQSRVEIERMIIKNLDESSTPEEMRASEQELKKLGLVPPDFQLREFIIGLLTEQVAGYYDPKTQEFYLADWIDVDAQKTVMAHELTHALQDQHFNLRRFEKWPKGDSDAELAAHALIEGDATLAMMYYALRSPKTAGAGATPPEADDSTIDQLNKAPRALRESLLFPYERGMNWAFQVHKRSGWDGLSQAFTKPPQSTEQIMHPDKYFVGEMPVKVEAPNLAAKLGARWRRTDYDVHGEWSFYLVLGEFLKDDAQAKKAAAGWSGDRFALYEGARPEEVMIAMLSVWDTERDAREFFEAYARRTDLRYETARSGAAITSYEWRTKEGRVMLEQRGARVAILEGVPEKANTGGLMRLLWK